MAATWLAAMLRFLPYIPLKNESEIYEITMRISVSLSILSVCPY
jgi:hypothetical protein